MTVSSTRSRANLDPPRVRRASPHGRGVGAFLGRGPGRSSDGFSFEGKCRGLVFDELKAIRAHGALRKEVLLGSMCVVFGEEMRARFVQNCGLYPNVYVENRRIDVEHTPEQLFDRVFISFVLHGLPHEARLEVLRNAHRALKPGGTFHILDYSEFEMASAPFYVRTFFSVIECPMATDYVERDWKALLQEAGFGHFRERAFFLRRARLLSAEKLMDA